MFTIAFLIAALRCFHAGPYALTELQLGGMQNAHIQKCSYKLYHIYSTFSRNAKLLKPNCNCNSVRALRALIHEMKKEKKEKKK